MTRYSILVKNITRIRSSTSPSKIQYLMADVLFNRETTIELSSASLGAQVLFATDEWFAICENLLTQAPPTFDPDAFHEWGKVMDGWESRRRVSWSGGGKKNCWRVTLFLLGGRVVLETF